MCERRQEEVNAWTSVCLPRADCRTWATAQVAQWQGSVPSGWPAQSSAHARPSAYALCSIPSCLVTVAEVMNKSKHNSKEGRHVSRFRGTAEDPSERGSVLSPGEQQVCSQDGCQPGGHSFVSLRGRLGWSSCLLWAEQRATPSRSHLGLSDQLSIWHTAEAQPRKGHQELRGL